MTWGTPFIKLDVDDLIFGKGFFLFNPDPSAESTPTAIPLIKTQNPILGTVMQVGVDSALGSGLKRKKPLPNIKSSTSNLINGVPQVIKIRNGGSFREL